MSEKLPATTTLLKRVFIRNLKVFIVWGGLLAGVSALWGWKGFGVAMLVFTVIQAL